MVHKGLDLTLEAFVQLPDCQLTVVGPVSDEPEFVNLYRKELFHTANIKLVGWQERHSETFRQILNQSVAHVFPSCSEAGAAVVLETMAAGLIPIVTYEASVDVEDFGILLRGATVEDIVSGVRSVASVSASEMRRRAKKAWEYAHTNNTPEAFAKTYRATMEMILAKHGKR